MDISWKICLDKRVLPKSILLHHQNQLQFFKEDKERNDINSLNNSNNNLKEIFTYFKDQSRIWKKEV